MASAFTLDPRIEAATCRLGEAALCLVRMMDDRRYPWIVLIPRRPDVAELFDLMAEDRGRLMDEIAAIAEAMAGLFPTCKLNVAMLGNRVRQLHLHVVARSIGDAAWPNAVWDGTQAEPYAPAERELMRQRLLGCLPAMT